MSTVIDITVHPKYKRHKHITIKDEFLAGCECGAFTFQLLTRGAGTGIEIRCSNCDTIITSMKVIVEDGLSDIGPPSIN